MTTQERTQLEIEVIQICQDLIRIPSVNYGDGKGDEKAVAEYVVKSLGEVGIDSKVYESAPGRCTVIAKIKGRDSSRPGLVLHGHLDVVPAIAADWSVDPFSGVIKDGMIWGRGAVDMKDMDAMMLANVRDWARRGYLPPRDIVLAFFADEEAGGVFGSRWMVKNHPEVFDNCSEAVSEVGGFDLTLANGARLYMIETAEKGIHWMKLTAHGRAGHGSVTNNENALTALSGAVHKIGTHLWPLRMTKTMDALLVRVAAVLGKEYDRANPSALINELGSFARMMAASIQNTANPTMLAAGYKANVIPGSASATIDCRFIPGFEEELNETIRKIIGADIIIETITRDKALEVDFTGDLVEAMCNALLKYDPEGIPVPYLMSGGTDNKALADLGIIGYGFSPLKLGPELDFAALFHGVDERVPVDALIFGVNVLAEFLENA